MCGICGIVDFSGKPVQEELVRRMNHILAHRGPDDDGFYFAPSNGPSVAFGHRRLSIIDLGGGRQPLSNEDRTIWIVFNGEIYNFQELRTILESKGHTFRTNSDTESIVHAYEQWGTGCVERLRGMFAFAIWDEKAQKLLVARDRLGIKPVYYYLDNRRIIFASEIKSILQDTSVKREVDLEALSDYLSLLYVPAPKTMFKNIHKLPAGHILLSDARGREVKEYWDVSFARTDEKPEEQWTEEIVELLSEAVRIRLISEVPLGAFLSGGVDSSSVVGLMSTLMSDPVITNSIGFKETAFNELDYAREVAGLFNCRHHEYTVTPDALDVIDKLAFHYDEPFADSSAIPTYYVSQVARQNVTVALSGDGGDENFAGYRRYFYDRLENRVRDLLPRTIRETVVAGLAQVYPKADWLPQVFRAKSLLTNLSLSPATAFFYSVSQLLPGVKERILSKDVKDALQEYDTASIFQAYFNRVAAQTGDSLSRVQYIDIKTYLVDDILTKVDRASMAHALEVRVPILDHKFVELVATVPSHLKLNGRESKYIFKKAMSRLLPERVLYRNKMGFSIPIQKWFRKEIKVMAEGILFGTEAKNRGLFDYSFIEKLWQEHQRGTGNHSSILWALLMFEKWHQRWM
ncbi:MAG: XrtA/PEP-CTERM system amidotransferase [Pseudomonadota bacterium]